MPPLVALGMAWWFIRNQHLGGALLIIAGFDSFLRTGEMLSLTLGDFSIDDDYRGVIKLEHTKTGQRHAAFEASVIADPMVGKLFTLLKRTLAQDTHPDHYLFAGTQHAFYKLFKEGLKWLGVSEHGFQVYSVRRGGATSFFRKTRNMEATLDRGRWSSARVARIYVNDGLAKQVELNFDTAVKARLNTLAGALSIWLKQNGFGA